VLAFAAICALGGQAAAGGESEALRAIQAKDGKAHAAQFEDAIRVNVRKGMRAKLAPIVAAIRYAENGARGIEYGIVCQRGKSYRTQAGWAAATVQKHWDRYRKAGGSASDTAAFLRSLAARYCPVGADNDPKGLNKHWLGNVTRLRREVVEGKLGRKQAKRKRGA
jgi:hypothetical protein